MANNNAVRGDNDVLALLNEMTHVNDNDNNGDGQRINGGDEMSAQRQRQMGTTNDGTSSSISAGLTSLLAARERMNPPSNPQVEILRHRCHEKFKAAFYDMFRSCATINNQQQNHSTTTSTKQQEQYQCIRSTLNSVWKSMPPHNIWERFQFSLKTLEADCVRKVQAHHHRHENTDSSNSRRSTNVGNVENMLQQMIIPTIHQIHTQIIEGKCAGMVWEPLLPVPSISTSSSGSDEELLREMEQRYRHGTLQLLREELEFQFRRTFKQLLGGSDGKLQKPHSSGKGKGEGAMPLKSVDELYDMLKLDSNEDSANPPRNGKDAKRKSKKKSKKEKKSSSKSQSTNTSSDSLDIKDKEQYILQTIFASNSFQKLMQKVHKKFFFLAEDHYTSFLNELQKCSNRWILEEQSRASSGGGGRGSSGKKRKRNHGSGGGGMPKIAFVEEKDDDSNSNRVGSSNERQLSVTFAGISLRINERHKNKLYALYRHTLSNLLEGHGNNNGSNDDYSSLFEQYLNQFPKLLFTTLLRYDALEGAGLQSAIPPTVFHYLNGRFGCEFECFASPFNCWVEQSSSSGGDDNSNCNIVVGGGRYGSAFGDTDTLFGSRGSFFDIDFVKLAEESSGDSDGDECGGCFQANPPFASEFIERMCKRMDEFLSMSNVGEEGAQHGDWDDVTKTKKIPPLMFVIFVPAWSESTGWKTLSSSPHMTKHILLSQKEDVHYYAEGTQHRRRAVMDGSGGGGGDEKKGSHRIASFDTSVFFLQNDAAKEKWPLADDDGDNERLLKTAFAMKSMDEKEKIGGQMLSQKKKKKKANLLPDEKTNESKLSQKAPQGNAKELSVKQKKNKKRSQDLQLEKGNKGGASKKKRLVSGGQDEMNILASMGILDSASSSKKEKSKQVPDNDQSSKGQTNNSVKKGFTSGKKKKKRRQKKS